MSENIIILSLSCALILLVLVLLLVSCAYIYNLFYYRHLRNQHQDMSIYLNSIIKLQDVINDKTPLKEEHLEIINQVSVFKDYKEYTYRLLCTLKRKFNNCPILLDKAKYCELILDSYVQAKPSNRWQKIKRSAVYNFQYLKWQFMLMLSAAEIFLIVVVFKKKFESIIENHGPSMNWNEAMVLTAFALVIGMMWTPFYILFKQSEKKLVDLSNQVARPDQ